MRDYYLDWKVKKDSTREVHMKDQKLKSCVEKKMKNHVSLEKATNQCKLEKTEKRN